MRRLLTEMWRYGWRKALRYPANSYSWILADLALYASLFLTYALLFQRFGHLGGYTKEALRVYILTYALVNNFFAIFFAEGLSALGRMIKNGAIYQLMSQPIHPLWSLFARQINMKAFPSFCLIFPLTLRAIFEMKASLGQCLMYFAGVLAAVWTMMFCFLLLQSCLLLGWRLAVVQHLLTQFFSIAEKPDTFFSPQLRRLLTYAVPAFLTSAIPAALILESAWSLPKTYLFVAPVLFYCLWKQAWRKGLQVYQSEM